jgi:hypothetical protein
MISSGPRLGLRDPARLGPRIEIGVGHLHERNPGRRHVVAVIELPGLIVASAFAHPYLNWSSVKATARLRFNGLASTGAAERSAETGSGSTPRNGPGSMATVTADSPRSAII